VVEREFQARLMPYSGCCAFAKLAADKVSGEYAIKADGALQTLLFAIPNEAKHFVTAFKAKPKPTTPDRPCNAAYQVAVDIDGHKAMATKYDLY
jgi:hypothetical protein